MLKIKIRVGSDIFEYEGDTIGAPLLLALIDRWFTAIATKVPPIPDAATSLLLNVGPVSEQSFPGTEKDNAMQQLTDTQQVSVAVSATTKRGRPAQVHDVVFSSSDENVATVEADADDASKALVKAVGEGTAQINVSADADLGEGVTTIHGALDVTVIPSQATQLALQTGTPEEQGEPAEPAEDEVED